MTANVESSSIKPIEKAFDKETNRIIPPRQGDFCPNCGKGKLDYNGLRERIILFLLAKEICVLFAVRENWITTA
jgi:hypothetical protein